MALTFSADQPQRDEAFDPVEGCAIAPRRLFILPDDLALRLAAWCAARGEDDAEAVLLDLVELGLDELEEPGDPALSALEDADTFRRDGSPLPDGDDA